MSLEHIVYFVSLTDFYIATNGVYD